MGHTDIEQLFVVVGFGVMMGSAIALGWVATESWRGPAESLRGLGDSKYRFVPVLVLIAAMFGVAAALALSLQPVILAGCLVAGIALPLVATYGLARYTSNRP
jgi:hypothetical protein